MKRGKEACESPRINARRFEEMIVGKDHKYSSLGADRKGFKPDNAAYTKPRFKRNAFIDKTAGWLQYGNLLMLPQRLLIALTDLGYLYRGAASIF